MAIVDSKNGEVLHRPCSLPAGTPALVLVNCRFKRRVYLHLVSHTLEVFIFQVKQFTSFGKLILSINDFDG
jgi:hypothetical protein